MRMCVRERASQRARESEREIQSRISQSGSTSSPRCAQSCLKPNLSRMHPAPYTLHPKATSYRERETLCDNISCKKNFDGAKEVRRHVFLIQCNIFYCEVVVKT